MVERLAGDSALMSKVKNKGAELFLMLWEQTDNPAFDFPEFEGENEAGGETVSIRP